MNTLKQQSISTKKLIFISTKKTIQKNLSYGTPIEALSPLKNNKENLVSNKNHLKMKKYSKE